LAESLSAQTTLSHPETLWVFYAAARESYRHQIRDRVAQMDLALGGPGGLHRLDVQWERLFEGFGIAKSICSALNSKGPDLDALMSNVQRDTVLLKENPAPIDWSGIRNLAANAVSEWRQAA
jgi:alcohol dehydrogenase class IV